MRNTILTFTFLILIVSCSNNEQQDQIEIATVIKTKQSLNSKKNVESTKKLIIDQETINVKLSLKDSRIVGKTTKGSVLLSKKTFTLTPIDNNFTMEDANKVIKLQERLKQKELIGLESELVTITGKNESNAYLFQEGFDKRIIESNKRRDGVIFTIKNSEVDIKHTGSISDIDSLKESLNNRLQKVRLNKSILKCHFEIKKLDLFNSITNNDLKNCAIGYYLNPVSNKIELFTYIANNDSKFYVDFLSSYNLTAVNNKPCSSLDYLNYFKVSGDTLSLINSKTTIDRGVIIPSGFMLRINNKSTINVINNGFIYSQSPVILNGSEADSIKFISTDKTSMGFHVLNATKKSSLNYVSFNNFNNLNSIGTSLPSAVTFYESEVDINNCSFSNNNCEDALNIFRSSYVLKNSTIKNTFSDAFDADFSNGLITNCTFINSGNDAIDISGSELKVLNCKFVKIADKALSAGENSIMNVDSIFIDQAALAIVAKDLSTLTITNSKITNCDVAFSAFQKKKEFGPSSINSVNVVTSNIKEEYLVETNSSLKIEEVEVEIHRDDVKKILYGNEYGKATVK